MNNLLRKVTKLLLGLSLAAGVGVAIGSRNKSAGVEAGTATMTSFSALSGYVNNDTNVSYEASKGSAATAPAVNSNQIRIYQNGGLLTVSGNNGSKLTSITIGSAMATKVQVSVDGGSYSSDNSISASGTFTKGSISADEVVFKCTGTDKNSRLYLNYLSVDYSSSKTLSSISLSGSMEKTSYTTSENWDPTGLVVTGTYSDSTTGDLTSTSTFKYFDSNDVEVAKPSDLGIGSNQTLKVVASHTGASDTGKYVASTSINVTKAIEYEIVTDPSKLTKGTTFVLVGNSTLIKAMQISRTTSNGASSVADVTLSNSFSSGSVATSANATVFTLGGSTGAWTIKNGNNQLGFTGTSNNNMQFNENQTDTFSISTQSGNLLSIESNTYSGRKLQYNYNSGSPRFSNYNGGQTYVYMFANIAEVSYGTTDHISISSHPQTEYASGETFNSSGLVITAWDGNDEATANSKLVEPTSVSLSGTTFTDEHLGSNTVTVTYRENETNYTVSYSIYVYASATYQLVTSEPAEGWAGNYLITSTVSTATEAIPNTGTYAMKSSLSNFDVVGNYLAVNPVTTDGVKTIVAGQHLQFSIHSVSGGYSIQGQSGKYIGWNSSSSNGISTSDSALVNTISISGNNVTILCSAGTKGLTLNTSSGEFRYYSNATVQLYKLVESSEATTYAESFLEMLSTGADPVCVSSGKTDLGDLQVAWAILAGDFNDLSNADKQLFTQGTADETGDEISQALALYDFVATKYGENLESQDCSNFDFMSRGITPLSGVKASLNNLVGETSNTIAIIVIISLVSVTAIGGYFFIKRRQEN